jgi:hypothetical protein
MAKFCITTRRKFINSRLIGTSAFILPKKQIYLIRSTLPVPFFAFKFEQHLFFPAHDGPTGFCHPNRSSRGTRHLPFPSPDMKQSRVDKIS